MGQDEQVRTKLPVGSPVTETQDGIRARTGGLWTEVSVENAAAHSGSEPHDVWFNLDGRRFADLGGLSGFRDRGDGRVLVVWDPNGDGLLDLAAVHANAPRLRLWENRLGAAGGRSIVIRLEGGARPDDAEGWSNRDGVGAVVRAVVGERVITRTLTLGEGMASESTAAVHIGLGESAQADRIEVLWPSGRTTALGPQPAGAVLRIGEREGGAAREGLGGVTVARPRAPARTSLPGLARSGLVTTFATWCVACAEELPVLAALADAQPGLTLLGAPVDPDDGDEAVADWVAGRSPPWELLTIPAERREALRADVTTRLGYEAVPTTLLLGEGGEVRAVWAGPPTLSEVREALGTQ